MKKYLSLLGLLLMLGVCFTFSSCLGEEDEDDYSSSSGSVSVKIKNVTVKKSALAGYDIKVTFTTSASPSQVTSAGINFGPTKSVGRGTCTAKRSGSGYVSNSFHMSSNSTGYVKAWVRTSKGKTSSVAKRVRT